ncbi:hypothetical protein EV401DRAFT_2196177 [Pisolithus croceorrhizus]|nr:hypothetical protein EV401DRAFT_2196177 [Pisolithus croceorrhizus]
MYLARSTSTSSIVNTGDTLRSINFPMEDDARHALCASIIVAWTARPTVTGGGLGVSSRPGLLTRGGTNAQIIILATMQAVIGASILLLTVYWYRSLVDLQSLRKDAACVNIRSPALTAYMRYVVCPGTAAGHVLIYACDSGNDALGEHETLCHSNPPFGNTIDIAFFCQKSERVCKSLPLDTTTIKTPATRKIAI